jgi:large subunit ribosomal protein L21
MFAVIRTGGKQYRVVAKDKLKVARVEGDPGTIVQFGDVLAVGGDKPVLGTPAVAGASVAAEVLEHGRGDKVIAFKKRRRKNSRRKRGYRDEFTLVQITEILTDGAKPTIGPRPKREPKPVEPSTDEDGETKPKAKAAKKAPAKKAAAKKAPAKKAAAKKPATKSKK